MGLLLSHATHEHNKRALRRQMGKIYSQHKLFKLGKVGQEFMSNGAHYVKSSTRTARLVENNRVFYFGQNEIVKFKPLV